MNLLIGLTYDLRSDYLAAGYSVHDVAEFDSDATVNVLARTLSSLGHEVVRIGSVRELCSRLVSGQRWDLVFNIAEGFGGRCREAQVPALLEAYDLTYTFSDPLVCAVTLDKAIAKKLVREASLATPAFRVLRAVGEIERYDWHFPVFVKPNDEGTGKGIDQRSLVRCLSELRALCQDLMGSSDSALLVEEYLPGREFTVGILGTGAQAQAIGTMEITVLPEAGTTIYTFEVKENCEQFVKYSALREPELKAAVESLALACYRVLECRDAGRVDIRLDADGRPSFLEINPLPGLHPEHSDLPMIATQEGMAYPALISAIVDSAAGRIPSRLRRAAQVLCA